MTNVPVALVRSGRRVEQDPSELLGSLEQALSRALRELGAERKRVLAVGLATQRSSLLCWDRRDLRPLTPVLSWQDTRGADALSAVLPDAGRVRELTGLRPSAHYGASKLRWCLDNVPDVRRAADSGHLCMGPLSSWLSSRLCGAGDPRRGQPGRPWVDPCNGARTLLMDRRGRWSEELLGAFGIEERWLPEARGNRAPPGWRLVAAELPLAFTTGDQSAVPFGVGVQRGDVVANLGTGGFLLRCLGPEDRVSASLLEATIWRDETSEVRVGEATVNGCGAAVAWFAERSSFSARDIDAWLAGSEHPALFLNSIGGLGSPDWRPDLQPRFRNGEVADQAAGVIESIAFLLRRNLELLGAPGRVILTGGLARSRSLVARVASVLGRTVERCDETEATSRGVADRLLRLDGGLPAAICERIDPLVVPGLEARYETWTRWLQGVLDEPVALRSR